MECQQHNACVSEIFSGYRDVPHIVVAVKSMRADGRFFVLRATLETERLIQTFHLTKPGSMRISFWSIARACCRPLPVLRRGIPSGGDIPVPAYSDRTKAVISTDRNGQPILIGYAFINTTLRPTSFILMVVKQKAGMMKVWLDLRSQYQLVFRPPVPSLSPS
jgi:two-component system NtrC family sensor kinase